MSRLPEANAPTRTGRAPWRWLGLALVSLMWASPAWADWTISALMQQLARQPAGQARFVETKTLSMLDAPVMSSGKLVYSPPDRLEKNTLLPKAESMVVERDRLVLTRDGRRREVRLQQYPEVLAIVEGIRGTLVGNQSLLQQHYALLLLGTEADWRLALTPLDERMQRWVRQITVSGKRSVVTSIETLQSDGDRSVMAIEPEK